MRALANQLLQPRTPAVKSAPAEREWIPGEIIVRFKTRLTARQAIERWAPKGFHVEHGGFGSEFLHLFKIRNTDGSPISLGQTRELAAEIGKVPGVRFTEINFWQHAFKVPNDKLYSAQWHYAAMNLPAAWDVTTGNPGLVIADVDTGIVPHPDLDPRLVPGFDMISDGTLSGDGDGRDNNPLDEGGDEPQGGSSWHGTHTAGTLAAATDNSIGVAGVDWNAKLLVVRVLGRKGGTGLDIAAGITWAAGGTVTGVPANPNPAKVVNLSLGGPGEASPTYQDAIDAANAKGAILVIAAGNAGVDASGTIPCIQQNVICVGATRFSGTRASYSNFGAPVHVMAPGGEMIEDANGDGEPDGVLSTLRDSSNNNAVLGYLQGTSMACPHVAGVVALMKGVNPGLTVAQAKMFLTQTANPASKCNEGCGAGMVNAQAAVLAAKGQAPSGPAKLSANTTDLFFVNGALTVTLGLSNTGGMPLTVNAAAGGAAASALSFPKGASITLAGGASGGIDVTANLAGLMDGTQVAAVNLTSNGGNLTINAKIKKGGPSGRPGEVGLISKNSMGEWKVAKAVTVTAADGYKYQLDGPPGTYFVLGVIDDNGNGAFDTGESVGLYPNDDSPKEIEVKAGATLEKIDFPVVPSKPVNETGTQIIGGSCTMGSCPMMGVCVTAWPSGYCTADCSTVACPLGSTCLDTGTSKVCLSTCPGVGVGKSTCRTSYVCYDDGTGKGLCLPACAGDPDCGTGGTCNTSTGYCQ